MTALRNQFAGETIIRSTGVATGAALMIVALSRWSPLTALALIITGICWTISTSMFNVAVQLSAPRWVAGRALSAYQALVSGGMAIGSWLWGVLTDQAGVTAAFLAAGVFAFASQVVGAWMRIPDVGNSDEDAASGSA
jgi:predicted MFS family arabinose efflux permease